jgi:polysaccharide biosynthesis protein PslH
MRILIVTPEPATALKARVFRFAKILSKIHEVHLAFVEDMVRRQVPAPIRYAADLELQELEVKLYGLRVNWFEFPRWTLPNLWKGLPFKVALYDEPRLTQQVQILADMIRPDIIHADRLRTYPLVSHLPAPKVVDFTDPMGWYYEERARRAQGLKAKIFKNESTRKWRFEREVGVQANKVIFASDFGANIFRERFPEIEAAVVPNPIQTKPITTTRMLLPGTRPAICYFGNLYYPPNVQSITGFVRHVWSVVKSRIPQATLHIAGSRPHQEIIKLSTFDGVHIHPNLKDMGLFLRSCDLSITPLTFCAGFPNKIVDAVIEGGIPVIASREAQVGLPSSISQHLLLAAEPLQWAEQIFLLWNQPELRRQTVEALRTEMREFLSEDIVLAKLSAIYDSAMKH